MFDYFLFTGTVFFVILSLYNVIRILDYLYGWWLTRQHDQYCEDCADGLMAETFKSMREKDE